MNANIFSKLSLKIPSDIEVLHLVQSFTKDCAKLLKLDNKFISRLDLLTEEALSYIIKSSYKSEKTGIIKIKVYADGLNFIVSFFDLGLPSNEKIDTNYNPKNIDTLNDIEGIELFFLKHYTHKIGWVNHGVNGKELKLEFSIPQTDITTIEEKQTPTEPEIDPNALIVRKLQKLDALEVSRAIYKTYGYTYPNEDLYYPQKIYELNKEGRLISVIAYDEKNKEAIGHYALERDDLGVIAESGQAVVSPFYRGHNLMSKMRNMLEEIALEMKLEGIIAQPVTSHIFSQKVNIKNGSSVCGVSFAIVPKELNFKKTGSFNSQRVTCLLYFKPLIRRKRVINLPKKHKKIIEQIYKNLKLPYKISQKKELINQKGNVEFSYIASWGIGVINVDKIGLDNLQNINTSLNKLRLDMKAEAIFLYIALEDEPINKLVKQLEKIGFFFCGIAPSFLNSKDVIRFEYLNTSVDTKLIQVISQKAQTLYNYVKDEMQKALDV